MNDDSTANQAEQRLTGIEQRIQGAAQRAGRAPEAIRLLAVSKTKPTEAISALYRAGQRDFGENYLQEGLDKIEALRESHPDLCWHFIGPIQSNKTRAIAEQFHWAHSVDRLKIGRRLARQRPSALDPLNICIQVNISREPQKAGVLPEAVAELADELAGLEGIRLRGLMCLPAPSESEAEQRRPFQALRTLLETLNARGHTLDTLSMGMSADLEAAILEGSTLLRVGTALFGPRD